MTIINCPLCNLRGETWLTGVLCTDCDRRWRDSAEYKRCELIVVDPKFLKQRRMRALADFVNRMRQEWRPL